MKAMKIKKLTLNTKYPFTQTIETECGFELDMKMPIVSTDYNHLADALSEPENEKALNKLVNIAAALQSAFNYHSSKI